MPTAALRLRPSGNGSDGWLSTGASIALVDHHPEREPAGEAHADGADTRPAACCVRIGRRARGATTMIGLVRSSANVANSWETQPDVMERST